MGRYRFPAEKNSVKPGFVIVPTFLEFNCKTRICNSSYNFRV
ncbi:hypothetical protein LEP1GSC008_1066 [Leptospira kirschneri serovar Bulgarica str. Nikolaevo]|uniref:Uncharacterized protein n=1 Tax=Leptospira kirschneri serovar Bulgarica str. Nikolaevo TaxID=1240687 RepID=M6F668_9LEPT|nr:hypothetical protein LEP1GSC008_1066 [Leptospira kirschneri serovar Bulgarica str. Nikolaevo]